jgi:hypothetical protein
MQNIEMPIRRTSSIIAWPGPGPGQGPVEIFDIALLGPYLKKLVYC